MVIIFPQSQQLQDKSEKEKKIILNLTIHTLVILI
jgi:hypothetical protein